MKGTYVHVVVRSGTAPFTPSSVEVEVEADDGDVADLERLAAMAAGAAGELADAMGIMPDRVVTSLAEEAAQGS